jgi:exosortase/archaeosortase family protein
MGLYAGFILVFPGNWRSKIWFIPAGLVGIILMNISRIVGLYLTNKYWPHMMDINHHTVFKYTVFVFTFMLWWVWIRWFRLPHTPKNNHLAPTHNPPNTK